MSRAVSPVVGVVLLTGLTLVVAGVVGVVALGFGPPPAPAASVELSATADASSGWLVVVHESGPSIDVRDVDVRIEVDGTPLAHQPPVPFFAASGFHPPTGPFNRAADPRWELGERAGLRIAGTNDPTLAPGASVRLRLLRDDLPIATVESIAR